MTKKYVARSQHFTYTPIAPVQYTMAAGADGFVDQDASAALGTDTSRIWICQLLNVTGAAQGVRTPGDTTAAQYGIANLVQFVKTDANGHIEIYRVAGDTNYVTVSGYLR